MMDLSFYPLTMEAVDQADAEALCLFIGADERPLTGLAGLAAEGFPATSDEPASDSRPRDAARLPSFDHATVRATGRSECAARRASASAEVRPSSAEGPRRAGQETPLIPRTPAAIARQRR